MDVFGRADLELFGVELYPLLLHKFEGVDGRCSCCLRRGVFFRGFHWGVRFCWMRDTRLLKRSG